MLKETMKETKVLNTGKKNIRVVKKTITGDIIFYDEEGMNDAVSK
jgi:hypothetical protein